MSTPAKEHKADAQGITPRCAILTVSDTRTPDTDTAGPLIRRLLTDAGAVVDTHDLCRDEPAEIHAKLSAWLARDDLDLLLTTGGTGVSRRDQTVDVVELLIERPLPGFGELFRFLSYEQVGSAALLSRATAGVTGQKLIVALPGSKAAVELAVTRLVVPEMRHLLREARR